MEKITEQELNEILTKYGMTKEQYYSLLNKNMYDAKQRLQNRLNGGSITYDEFKRLWDFEERNFESGGLLYAQCLQRAISPSDKIRRAFERDRLNSNQ